jgi:hypothetical protein
VTLYPTEGGKRKARAGVVEEIAKPIKWKLVDIGEVYETARAPRVAQQAFEISCKIEGENPGGVILAHGGAATGYSLYATLDGEIVFAVRHSSGQITRVREKIQHSSGCSITARLRADGLLSLALDDGEPATAKSAGVLRKHPQEDLCIGHDAGNPVDEEAPGGEFGGRIVSVDVALIGQ